jgi:glycosyltransferase involved in cell wall biosynthesis
MALVTIITVTYNASQSIEETILSVINQTEKNYEFIIIDGGSNDGTLDILNTYGDNINKLISEKDNGIYDAMNKGIMKTNSDFIFFLNSGDILLPDSIKNFLKIPNIASYDIIYGNVSTNDKHENIYYAKDLNHMYLELPFCHQAVFVKSKLMKENLFSNKYKIAADYNFFLNQYMQKKDFLKTNFIFSKIDLNGISNVKTSLAIKEYLSILYLNNNGLKKILLPLLYLKSKKRFLIYKSLIYIIGINNYIKIKKLFT